MADASIAYAGPVVTRATAKTLGLTRYFQGSSCPQGHIAERHTGNGECVICSTHRQTKDVQKTRDRNARSRLKHLDVLRERERKQAAAKRSADPDAARERDRAEYRANPERAMARRSRWVEKNREYVRERTRAYHVANVDPAIAVARVAQWRKDNPDRYIAQKHARRARKLGAEGTYDPEDVQRMLHDQGGVCNGCSADIRKNYTIDHMTPLSRGGSNWPANLQLLCKPCNSAKNDRTMEEWLAFRNKDGTFKHRSTVHPDL